MKKISTIFLSLTCIILAGCSQLTGTSITREKEAIINEKASIINCKLSLSTTLSTDYKSDYNKIDAVTNEDKNPLEITFVGVDTDQPKMKGNYGETELTKIDNGESIYLIEKTGAGNINIFTFFPKENTLLMSKQYWLGGPFGLQMAGFCE